MKDNWLEELREGMSDFEMDAPEGLWESLGVEKPVSKGVWRNRWITAAAVIAILVIGSVVILWLGKTESLEINDIKYAKTNGDGHPTQSESNLSDSENTAPTFTESLRLTEARNANNIPNNFVTKKEITDSYVSHEESIFTLTDTVKTEGIKTEAQEIPSDDATKSVIQHKSEDKESFYTSPLFSNIKRQNTDRFAINMSASGIGNAAEGTFYRIPGLNGNDYFLSGSNTEPWFAASSLETMNIRHHLPVRFGLTLQYNVSQRIGIETGLVYTYLASDISVSRDNLSAMGIRRLQYVGIPLNVKFSAWSWKFIGIYLSAGATGEKCVSNRFETKYTAEGMSLDAFSSQKEKPFQWSVNTAVGIQLRPVQNIGIFAEPGVSYYFNDGSSLSTIYKDRPCSFNLNIGLRFTLNP